jgi:5-methylcytosine-specific restriction endonuclease McrA
MTSRYISRAVSERVRKQADNECGYCLSQQRYVLGKLEIEHIIPQALGGTSDENNL